jgi:tRNA threonylcarbamoyladenosine biosynthesis protein TsaE
MKKNNFIDKSFNVNSSEETQKLSFDFAKILEEGDTVCLYGDLGFGKTTFTQGLARGLGIENRIISPTFVIMRSYEIKNNESKIINFYHIDLYRIETEEDVDGLGIEEIINNKNNITVIEWAEKLKKYLPKKRIDIEFFYEKDSVRKIVFRSLNQ